MDWLDTHSVSVQALATLVLVAITAYYAWASRSLVRETRTTLQASARATLQDFVAFPGYNGGNPWAAPPLNQKGLLDQFGKPKPAYAAVKRIFDEIVPLHRPTQTAQRAAKR